MNHRIVNSESIKTIGWQNDVLELSFASGGLYRYFHVPKKTYLAMMKAISKGKFFHDSIRDRYKFAKIA